MKIQMFQVDAFAEKVFAGNPAAVCPLESWLDDAILQAIAEENNLSETAFFVQSDDGFKLRWFTPVEEVDLCGHATLAAAHVLYEHLKYPKPEILFHTRSGELTVSRDNLGLSMDFPAERPKSIEGPKPLYEGLGKPPKQILAASDYLAVYDTEEDVRSLSPNFQQLLELDLRGVIATAPGTDADFVSRCFFPKLRINEDPVTGSAHCQLMPYWSDKLQRSQLKARQISKRGGVIHCEIRGDRVLMSGTAKDYMVAEISI